MRVEFVGFSKEEEAHLAEALRFFCKILFHGNMLSRMTFYIEKHPELDIDGECFPVDDGNRTFVISIRCGECDDEPCATLAHELVHCKQWANRELGSTATVVARTNKVSGVIELGTAFIETWHGEVWKPKRGEHPYFDCPWEIEAYGKALGMMARWNDFQEKRTKRKNEDCISSSSNSFAISTFEPVDSVCTDGPDYYSGA